MRINRINIVIVLGLVVIVGIMALQFLLLRQAVQFEEKKFAQKVHVALLEICSKLNAASNTSLPQENPIKKIKDDYFIANVNSKFDSATLGFYLQNEFDKFDLVTDYEYSLYNCNNQQMEYCRYVSVNNKQGHSPFRFEKAAENLTYYFAVHFPQKSKYIYQSLKAWIIFSLVMLVALILYGYSAFTILQQKKYSELQRDFINNMTHEFKTPISSILIASNYLAGQAPIQADEKLKKYTGLIIQQTSRLNSHVEKILNLAKTEKNSLGINKTRIDIIPLIHTVFESILLKYPQVKIHTHGLTECRILADEFHFSNLVYNLLDNSVKYSSENPEIHITAERSAKNISLSFSDNGIGIAPKHLANVFDKFYRVPTKKSNEVNGFGLGLFYVKKICREHNWAISINSKEKSGTEVVILIPTNE